MKRTGLALSLVLVMGAPLAALAQAPEAQVPADEAPGGTRKQEGDYGGVNPSAPSMQAADKPIRQPPKKTLTWLGFTARDDGGAELFAQAATPFTAQQRIEGKTLVVLLAGLPKQARNTRRPLDTRFFDTAIARVTARTARAVRARKGAPGRPAGVEIRITFKDPRDAKESALRADTGEDGLHYTYLSFGPPSAPRSQTPASSRGSLSEPE